MNGGVGAGTQPLGAAGDRVDTPPEPVAATGRWTNTGVQPEAAAGNGADVPPEPDAAAGNGADIPPEPDAAAGAAVPDSNASTATVTAVKQRMAYLRGSGPTGPSCAAPLTTS
ncbi:hypothetical protein Ate01nite_37240 [Actinoplanes teichomyceticus]|nr:hypothetical protein Ate01nite_37240 [Actinoplanes teichomyceticus]